MAQLFDNICRTLATPMPRSRALKLILGGLAGAAMAPFAFGDDCPVDSLQRCGTAASGHAACCPPGQTCCLPPEQRKSNVRPVCCAASQGCVSGYGACAKPSPKQT